jgi:UDP-N-acetylmuramate dehydrogenase
LSVACDQLIQHDVPLADRTWFKLGGSARNFCAPKDVKELRSVLKWAGETGAEIRVLGGGANLLVRDGSVDGLVLSLGQPAFCRVDIDDTGIDDTRIEGSVLVKAGAGVDLMQLSRDCSHRGLAGLECLAGIPGSVGGAIAMNAGGRFGCIGDAVERVRLIDSTGVIVDCDAQTMQFGYRRSKLGDRLVIGAVLKLRQEATADVKKRFQDNWRFKKESQPLAAHSAGCVFKNPEGHSAGQLIDAAGLKGLRRGQARVSEVHGNFIVADEGACASEVLDVIEHVRSAVEAHSGIWLDTEIAIW